MAKVEHGGDLLSQSRSDVLEREKFGHVWMCVYLPFVSAVVSAQAARVDQGRQGRGSHVGDGRRLPVTQRPWFVGDLRWEGTQIPFFIHTRTHIHTG